MEFVQDGQLSLPHYAVNKYICPQYPLVLFVTPEEDLQTSSEESSSESDEDSEEMAQENDDTDTMEVDTNEDRKQETANEKTDEEVQNDKDKNTKNNEKSTVQTQEVEANNGTDNKKTMNDDEDSVVASNQTGKEKEATTIDNGTVGMELEESPMYMDVHLNIRETKDNTGPMAAITTLTTRLLS